ncbi:MAG: flagellar hook-associated protein FlgL [Oligoflexia bacterium]|nr:flagellar hook-associated protein FlgL [Oligoflexia bacterium]MBF0366116.1 flagellar hook-associated protein FlgL [Oligoflexia bacterium]
MSRVADTSTNAAIDFALNRAKGRMEDLQLKGAGIKKIIRPSDDPPGNIELMKLRSQGTNNGQFMKNANMALIFTELTEESLSELSEVLMKAKEIAVAQASSLYNSEVRRSVAEEVEQLGKQIWGIANRHVGNRYLFAGYKNEVRPFTKDGTYHGDDGTIFLEVVKDFYVPINIPGNEVFFQNEVLTDTEYDPLESSEVKKEVPGGQQAQAPQNKMSGDGEVEIRAEQPTRDHENIFGLIRLLGTALRTDDNKTIQDILERLDRTTDRIITLRTKIGSNVSTIRSTMDTLDSNNVSIASRKSSIEDADVAELFTDMTKQDYILKAVYRTGAKSLNQNLLDFLR